MLYNAGACQSRFGEFWNPQCLTHIRAALADVPDNIVLDGELYVHGKSLQQINSRVAVTRVSPHPDELSIEYHIFDLLDTQQPTLDFSYRHQLLVGIIQPQYPCVVVETKLCLTHGQAEQFHKSCKERLYEGSMYRVADSAYGLVENCGNKENRWKCLLKRKDFLDGEHKVIGCIEGEGKYQGMMGALVCRLENGLTFEVGTGYSDAERAEYFDNPPLGSLLRYRYEMLSDIGKPLKPVFEAIL